MNSDHLAVEVHLELTPKKKKNKKRRGAKAVSWKTVNLEEFGVKTNELVQNCSLEGDLQTRCKQIERILLDAAASSAGIMGHRPVQILGDDVTRQLIERRRTMKTGTAEKTEISKLVVKHLRNNPIENLKSLTCNMTTFSFSKLLNFSKQTSIFRDNPAVRNM